MSMIGPVQSRYQTSQVLNARKVSAERVYTTLDSI